MPINKLKYHKKWRLISYLIRVKRAGNKCEQCGAEQGKPHPITGALVVLTTAHLNRDRNNNRFWNLKALSKGAILGMTDHNTYTPGDTARKRNT